MPCCRPSLLLGALLLAGAPGLGCTIEPEGEGMPAPDTQAVYVFFPSGGAVSTELVRGRGLAGAMPAEATHVHVRSYPTGYFTTREVGPDGSFEFEIFAISGDVLEIRGATSASLDGLGRPVFLRVPPTPIPLEPFVCCPETNTCAPKFDYDREGANACPGRNQPGIFSCTTDVECDRFEGVILPLDPSRVSVSAPDPNGFVVVEGQLLPNVLVSLVNRGKSAVGAGLDEDERRRRGLEDPGIRLSRIADDAGRFRFNRVRAIADDEIVIRLQDLNGFRSPAYATRVPDPPLAGVDVLGVFPWEPLKNGERGTVALRLSPFGTDGRGICPDAVDPRDGLELCMGGGFEHGMITTFIEASIDFGAGSPGSPLEPVETATDANLPYNRGIEGNVRSGRLDLFVVLDMSEAAARADSGSLAFDAVESYVRYLRERDRVGLITFARTAASDLPTVQVELTEDRTPVLQALSRLEGEPRTGASDVLAAVRLAGERLAGRPEAAAGRILVVTFGPPRGTPSEAREALDPVLDQVERRPLQGFPGFPVDVVGVPFPENPTDTWLVLDDLVVFSQGERASAETSQQLEQALADLRGEQVGSFLLLYDVSVPENAGKAGTIRLEFQVNLGSETRTAEYVGPLPIANASNP